MTNPPTIQNIAEGVQWLMIKEDSFDRIHSPEEYNPYTGKLMAMKEVLEVQMSLFVTETLADKSLK